MALSRGKRYAKAYKLNVVEEIDAIHSEIVADCMFDVFSNERFVNSLVKENKTLAQKICDFIKELLSEIRNMMKNYHNSPEMEALRDMKALLDNINNIFVYELELASKKAQKAKNAELQSTAENREQKNNTTEDGGVKYSKKYLEAKNNQDIIDLVFKVENKDFKPNDKVFLENVSEDIAERIEVLTGIQVNGFKVAIEARQIEHILNEHGVNGKSDNSMSDVNDISKMEYVLKNPDEIRESGRTQAYSYMENGYNRTAKTVLYEKVLGGNSYYVVQAVPDTKKKTLYIVSAFIGKSGYKKEAPQLIDAKSPNVTPKDGSVIASTNIISDKVEKININSEKSVLKNEKSVKSLKLSPDAKKVLEENPELKSAFLYLQSQFKLVKDYVPSEEQLTDYAKQLKKSNASTKDVYEIKNDLRNIYSILHSMTDSRGLEYATCRLNIISIDKNILCVKIIL